MSLVVCQGADVSFLSSVIGSWGTLNMGVYVSSYTPQQTDTLAVYLPIEATFPGYVRQSVGGWSSPSIGGDGRAVTTASQVTFQNSSGAPQIVYGIFVMDGSQSNLFWAELDPANPVTIPDGGFYLVTPQFTMVSEF